MKKHVWLKGLLFSALLATVAGGTTVFAADLSGTVGPGESGADKNISAGQAEQGFNATDGKATAKSVGEFQIEAGKLTLDLVPNLHFTKADGSNPSIKDITAGIELPLNADGTVTPSESVTSKTGADGAFDGNTTNKLTVSDFRGDNTKGWILQAAVSPFTKLNGQGLLKSAGLNLTATKATRTGLGTDVDTPSRVTIPATNASAKVVDAAAGKGTLTNDFTFAGTSIGADSYATSLTIPSQAAQTGVYQAQLTWTLANIPDAGE